MGTMLGAKCQFKNVNYFTLAITKSEATMKDAYEKWEALCKEFEIARDAQFTAYTAVTRGFARVAKGAGGNPSEEESDAYERTSQRLDEIERRMDEFIEANT
jgi:hypothetical protein